MCIVGIHTRNHSLHILVTLTTLGRFWQNYLTASLFILSVLSSNCFKVNSFNVEPYLMRYNQENTTWNETTPVNFHFPVSSSEECQKLCQVGKYVCQAVKLLSNFGILRMRWIVQHGLGQMKIMRKSRYRRLFIKHTQRNLLELLLFIFYNRILHNFCQCNQWPQKLFVQPKVRLLCRWG